MDRGESKNALKFISVHLSLDGIDWRTWEEMCTNAELEKVVLKEIQSHSTICHLNKFEIPQSIKLVSEIWTPETDLVTAALKLKRKNIQTRYQNLIDIMYS